MRNLTRQIFSTSENILKLFTILRHICLLIEKFMFLFIHVHVISSAYEQLVLALKRRTIKTSSRRDRVALLYNYLPVAALFFPIFLKNQF